MRPPNANKNLVKQPVASHHMDGHGMGLYKQNNILYSLLFCFVSLFLVFLKSTWHIKIHTDAKIHRHGTAGCLHGAVSAGVVAGGAVTAIAGSLEIHLDGEPDEVFQ